MTDRDEWLADTEGNLTAPGEVKPPTDEFGRNDPDSLEREQRRQQRQAKRQKTRKQKPPKSANQRPKRAAAPEPRQTSAPPPSDGDGGDPVRGGPPGRYRRRRILALGLLFVGILFAWFLVALFQPPPFDPGDGTGTVAVTIPEGASAGEIADILTENDVVSNSTLFKLRLQLAGKTDEVQASRYVLAHDMSYGEAIDRLTGGGDKLTVTIPEGEDRFQIAPQVAELGIAGDYLAASQSHPGFNPAKYGAAGAKSLEGFLFPATYDLDRATDANTLVGEQLNAFTQNFSQVDLSYAKSKNLTPYDVLIIASMIDKEVQVASERPLVAAVIYNRLSRGMPLGIDATTRYQFHNYTGDITQSQLSSASPYNTRLHAGLTPTPIGNPGLDSIEAAARPAKVNYLYYVLKAGGGGNHCFTASDAEFNQLVAAYQQGRAPANCQS
jgi:peptidoglycan lytic transglycosylase G